MKITIDILDEEYMPECPSCQKPVNINDAKYFEGINIENVFFSCPNCLYFFDVELIVRQAKALKKI